MKKNQTITLFILIIILSFTSCSKNEDIAKVDPPQEQLDPMDDPQEEEKEEEEEQEEQTPDNPDLGLLGGQGAFTITPGSGFMSGETSVNLKVLFDDLTTQIPNDSIEYRIDWKTNGVYGSFTANEKEVSSSDINEITYTGTNIDVTDGEEKFVATLYSRPKGSEENFELEGSSAAAITITNEPNKKYSIFAASYWLVDSYPEAGGTRNFYQMGYTIPINEDAVLYQLQINSIIYGGFPFEENSSSSWTNESQPQFTYFDEEVNSYRVWLLSNSTNTLNQPTYDINFNRTINVSGTAQLIITLGE